MLRLLPPCYYFDAVMIMIFVLPSGFLQFVSQLTFSVLMLVVWRNDRADDSVAYVVRYNLNVTLQCRIGATAGLVSP